MATGCGTASQPDIDFSKIPYPSTLASWPAWEVAVKVTICVSVQLVAVAGNVLVIAIVAQSRKMRSTTNLYIVNLAVSDLLVAAFPVWIHLVDSLSNGWVLGAFLCKFSAFVQIAAMCSSVFTMMAIAGDRFFAILFPFKSRVTQRKVSVMVALVWLSAIAIGLPPLFVYQYNERQWLDHLEQFCTDVWPVHVMGDGSCDQGLTSKRAFWTLVVVVLNWAPMLVMTGAYTLITIKLRFNRVVPSGGSLSLSAIQQRSKRKVVKMLFSVLICFMVCTIPFQVSKLFELYRIDYGNRLPAWYNPVYFGAVVLMYASSALNPIIYGGFNENFRVGFRELVNRVLNRKSPNSHVTASLVQENSSRLHLAGLADDLGTKPNPRGRPPSNPAPPPCDSPSSASLPDGPDLTNPAFSSSDLTPNGQTLPVFDSSDLPLTPQSNGIANCSGITNPVFDAHAFPLTPPMNGHAHQVQSSDAVCGSDDTGQPSTNGNAFPDDAAVTFSLDPDPVDK